MNLLIDYIKNNESTCQVLDMQSLIIKCKHHALLPLLYKACKKFNCPLTIEQEKFLKKEFLLSVSKETVQQYELNEIINALDIVMVVADWSIIKISFISNQTFRLL